MLFSDKLVFLMELTGTSNLALAAELKTNPAQISLMRKGRRGQPQRVERLKHMAEYFALRATTDYHRAALADILGQQQIKLAQDASELAAVLYHWLSSTEELPGARAEQLLQEMNTLDFRVVDAEEEAPRDVPFEHERRRGGRNYLYYGNEGRRTAMREFLRCVQALEQPCEIIVSSDESFEWLLEAPAFAREIADQTMRLAERGFSCRRIAAPLLSADAAFDSLSRWLPLYMTGQVRSYYYPRLRDDLYRSTVYAAPGKVALTSLTVGSQTQLDTTLLITDKPVVELVTRRFESYFERCVPLTTAYVLSDRASELQEYLLRFESYRGNCIRRSCSFSSLATPPELLGRVFAAGGKHAGHRRDMFYKSRALFESNIAEYSCLDILQLADAGEVAAGRVPIALSYFVNGEPMFYTVEEYISQLCYLLGLLERWENYVVVLEENVTEVNAMYVKERQTAALIRTQPPFTVLEISESNAVAACQDYLNRIADTGLSLHARKQRSIFQIREAVRQFEQYL